MNRTALIDGDMFAFRAAVSSEEATHWGDGVWTLHADEKEAVSRLEDELSATMKKAEADDVVFVFSDPSGRYFRHKLSPSYKEGRSDRKPVVYWALLEYVKEQHKTYTKDDLEADDVLGILSTHPTIIKGEKVIVSGDKDFKTVPGLFYDYLKGDDVMPITEDIGDYWHLYQTLIGDSTDGYPGCPGVGPVKAKRILDAHVDDDGVFHPGPAWEDILKTFDKAGLGGDEAILQARLARILRACDYNFKTKEVILWTPTW